MTAYAVDGVAVDVGRIGWSVKRDKDGHRTYTLKTRVRSDYDDGPGLALFAVGLPTVGSYWSQGNEFDFWAFCSPEASVSPLYENERGKYWNVEQEFTTKPFKRCQDNTIEDPLAEPYDISGSFVRYQKRLEKDRFGKLVLSSSKEVIRTLTKDANRPTVTIGMNSPSLGLDIFSQVIDYVNDSPMWGVPARCVKLSNVTWSRKIYGTCGFYYHRKFDFEVRYDTFDEKEVADEGYMHYDEDEDDFIRNQDPRGSNNPTRLPLDGSGNINTDPLNSPVYLDPIQKYGQTNFLALGVPSSF